MTDHSAGPAVTDRRVLTGSAYNTDRDLAARQSLYAWQAPRYDLPGIVADRVHHVRGTVVDVGCGNGTFIRRLREVRPDLRLLGFDISAGILGPVPRPVAVADAVRLPLRANSVGGVLALHMLYHVHDIQAAIRELARVMTDDGTVIVSTNSARDKAELDELWRQAAGRSLGVERGPARLSLSSRFPVERAHELLGAVFSRIELLELPGIITVHKPDPVIAHMESYRAWADQREVPFQETIGHTRAILSAHLDRHGSFDITSLGGLLICRP
ncbi:class I SAM-dependent methyltransferase [Streptomyces sp. I05A-00742]|uniref:class I SAM-dependent methyltransferase n=1 Tax=Streptomyces sp. I05A-00742 TaxID=2732853 RepID=UPI001489E929|nr:class I SAM-dependent methyltransferase [Streptomyces sp. I05A-00742]